jgi:hypothetical protein
LVSSSGGPDLIALSRIFEEAKRWDAILLLDEADVVLEKRALEDVRRNTLVSGQSASIIEDESNSLL